MKYVCSQFKMLSNEVRELPGTGDDSKEPELLVCSSTHQSREADSQLGLHVWISFMGNFHGAGVVALRFPITPRSLSIMVYCPEVITVHA